MKDNIYWKLSDASIHEIIKNEIIYIYIQGQSKVWDKDLFT